MNSELTLIANRLTYATCPEDVFGKTTDLGSEFGAAVKKSYRAIVKVAHPDRYQISEEKLLAEKIFNLLNEWLHRAEEKIDAGMYGQPADVRSVKTAFQTKKREYFIDASFTESGIYNLYDCQYQEGGQTKQAVLQIVRNPANNDLAANEARVLNYLQSSIDADRYSPYIPSLVEAFVYDDGAAARQALVLEKYLGWYSLQDVRKAYPHGIDPKDMAWIWRRLLVVLGFAHTNRIIHGAVLPQNVWIQPEQHGLILTNWASAVVDPGISDERISVIDADYVDWYPEEVFKQKLPIFGLDILFAARCMVGLLGGDPVSGVLPASVPWPIKSFFYGCILPVNRVPQDAWALKEEFDELLERLWGERKFHPFTMK
jgi:serine/threonine protein kinase